VETNGHAVWASLGAPSGDAQWQKTSVTIRGHLFIQDAIDGTLPNKIKQDVRLNDTASSSAFVFICTVRAIDVQVYVFYQNVIKPPAKNVLIISQGRTSLKTP